MKKRGQHEGNVYQRGDGIWSARLRVGYRDGKRARVSVYGRTRSEVSEKLADLIRKYKDGSTEKAPELLTVGTFMAEWLSASAQPKLRPRTFETYSQVVRSHLVPGLGPLRLRRLTPHQVQAWLNRMSRSGLSGRTCQHARAILRAALTQAVKWGYLSRNVAALVDPPRARKAEIRPLTPDQVRALLRVAADHKHGPLVTVAVALGLRQGELLGLRWDDVNLTDRTLAVRRALQSKKGGGWLLVEPKSERSRRTVMVPEIALAALRTHRTRQLEARLLAGAQWREHGFIFTSRHGTPLDAWAAIRAFKAVLKAAALPPVRFHDLRHTAATLLLAQGVDPRTIMATLGHSQISLTLNTYSHVLPSLQHDAADRMNRILVGQ